MKTPEMQRLPWDCKASDIVEASERDGGVIVDGWLNAGLLEQFNAELVPWLDQHEGTDSGSKASDEFLAAFVNLAHCPARIIRVKNSLVYLPSFTANKRRRRQLTRALTQLGVGDFRSRESGSR